MNSERDVKAAVKAILKDFGIWYFMPAMNGFGRPGIPDFVCCVPTAGGARSAFLAIEAKYGKNYCSSLQEMEGRKIEKAGGTWLVVYETNVDDVRVAIEALKRL